MATRGKVETLPTNGGGLMEEPQDWKPHAYQRRAVKFLLEHAAGGLFLDPGLGKTSINLSAFKLLQQEGVARRALVIAPLRVCYLVWPLEVQQWNHLRHLKLTVLHGDRKDALLRAQSDLFCVNPEGLAWLTASGRLHRLKIDTLIVDESTKFKRMTTNRFQYLNPFLPRFARRWINTGSPAAEGLLDLHGQCYLMDLGRTLGPFYSHYRFKYFEQHGYHWHPRDEQAEREIYAALKPYVLRLAAEDYLDMPERVENPIWIELPAKARAAYDQLEEELFFELDAAKFNAVNAGVLVTKLRQLAGGAMFLAREVDPETGVPRNGPQKWKPFHTAKVDAVGELVDELSGQQLLLNYEYGHERERLLKALKKQLGYEPPVLGGGSLKRDLVLQTGWNRREWGVMLGHAQSVGHGLNLQRSGAGHVGIFSVPHSYELYDQFFRRLFRQGSKAQRVVAHLFLVRDTVDEAVWGNVRRKRRGQDAFFEALQDYRRKRRRK